MRWIDEWGGMCRGFFGMVQSAAAQTADDAALKTRLDRWRIHTRRTMPFMGTVLVTEGARSCWQGVRQGGGGVGCGQYAGGEVRLAG